MAYNYGNFQNNGYSGQMYNAMTPINGYSGQAYNAQVPNMNWNQTQPQIPYQQPSYQNQQPQNQSTGNAGFVWVQGEAGAKAYPVAAGNSVLLMDSEAPVLYMKSTDASGRPLPIETYDLVKRVDNVQHAQTPQVQQESKHIDLSEYVKRADLESIVTEIVNKTLGD